MKFKRGDTFDFSGPVEVTDAAGDPVDLTGWTVASKIQPFGDAEKIELTAEWLGGMFTDVRVYALDTSEWPLGDAEMDIQFTSPGGAIVSTETATFKITKDIT